MNVTFAVWPAVAVLAATVTAGLIWGREAVRSIKTRWLPLLLLPLCWLGMIYWASVQSGSPGSYSFKDMLPLTGLLGATLVCVIWLLMPLRTVSAFFIIFAISNILMASWVWIRASVWLGSAL